MSAAGSASSCRGSMPRKWSEGELKNAGLHQDLFVKVGCCEGVVGTSSRGFIAVVPIAKGEGKDAPARFGRCALRLGPFGARVASPRRPILNHVERHKSFVYQEPRSADPVSKTEIEIPIQPRATFAWPSGDSSSSRSGRSRCTSRTRCDESIAWPSGVARRASSLVRRQEPIDDLSLVLAGWAKRRFLAGWAKRLSWKPPYQNLWVELFSPDCCEAGIPTIFDVLTVR